MPKLTPTTNDQLMHPLYGGGNGSTIPVIQAPFHGQRPDPLKPEKVAIIGTQPSSRMVAPYGDPTWAIWGTSPGNQGILPRVDAWFEMHCNFLWPQYRQTYGEAWLKFLNEQEIPVVAQDQRYIKRAVTYPIRRLLRKFGPYFFSSTFAYCMAFAIDAGVKEMGLYGVDMSSKDEYIQQRPGGHYFIQRARELGIRVVIPEESDLDQPPPLYGYQDATPYGRKLATRRFEVKDRITQIDQQIGPLQSQRVYLQGAAEDIDYFSSVYGSVDQLPMLMMDETPSIVPEPSPPNLYAGGPPLEPPRPFESSSMAVPGSSLPLFEQPMIVQAQVDIATGMPRTTIGQAPTAVVVPPITREQFKAKAKKRRINIG